MLMEEIPVIWKSQSKRPFEKELAFIHNDKIRNTTSKILEHMPAWFMKEGASSTGKYHPQYAQGEGGLYRHTCAAVKIFVDVIELEQYKSVCWCHDWGIAALILHDMCKYGYNDIPTKYTQFKHPLLVKEWLENLEIDEEYINNVCSLLESHMGQWNTSKYEPDVILPKPTELSQQLIHLCDYLASRKYLEVNFDE